MYEKIKEAIYSRTGAGVLCLVNGWFCAVNVSQGAWMWAGISGFFAVLMGEQWLRRGKKY